MRAIPIALQLYSVRDQTAQNFIKTLEEVAQIGYAGVELAGLGNLSLAEMKRVLADLNLKIAGSHIGLEKLETDLNQVIDENLELGNPWIVCPSWPESRRKSRDDWESAAASLNRIAFILAEKQLGFAYHNHAYEFQITGHRTGYEILLEFSDTHYLKMELDVYWAQFGEQDPAALMQRLGKRLTLLHLKEMANDPQHSMTELGQGMIDFPAIFKAAENTACEWYIVEQDICQRPSLESARLNFEQLRAWGLA
ncbi:sugar phosphate isomerase/epimerase [candidate division KSB1 bacterium]|nr:sugar phosphate isomerase/epimerase [candidate division KSB1 bacterium]